MKVTLLNGSPKPDGGNSGYFTSELKALLQPACSIKEALISRIPGTEYDLADIYDCDAVVFLFPLYVDGVPSHVVRFLEQSEKFLKSSGIQNIRVYGIVNSGFHEGHQNETAIRILRNWCARAGQTWGQGLGIGGGEMLGSAIKSVPMGHGPKTSVGKKLCMLAGNVEKGAQGDTLFVAPDFPRFLYIQAAHMGWRVSGKQNGLKRKDLFRRPGVSG